LSARLTKNALLQTGGR